MRGGLQTVLDCGPPLTEQAGGVFCVCGGPPWNSRAYNMRSDGHTEWFARDLCKEL